MPSFMELWGVLTGMGNFEGMDDRASVATGKYIEKIRLRVYTFKCSFDTLHSSIVHSKVGCAK